MIPYKDIGDNLTVNEFNGVISLLRDNINFEENLTINNSTVKGQYAEYVFDFQEATVLDNGILITNETLSNIGTVKLTKAVFPHSNYFLDLKIYSSEDVGISDMEHSDYIVTEISIPLKHNTEVNIPFETLEMDNIISFDAKIRINHKDLIIRGTSYINLSVDSSELGWNKPVTFTARYLDDEGIPIPEAQINFYNGETLLNTATTDDDGYASISHSFNVLGSYTVFATCEAIISNNVSVTVVKNTSALVLSTNTNSAFVGMAVNVTGSLKDGTIAMGNKSVELYNGATLLETLTTGSDGSFSTTVTMPSADISLLAVYTDSTGHYTDATSQNVMIQKVTEYTEVTFEGTTFRPITTASSPNFIGNNGNVIIDYGDGTISVSNNYNHTYSTSGEHTIKIYNATDLNNSCFQEVLGITNVILSNQIVSINTQAFFGCSTLENITLGSSIETIGDSCFDTCSFESINIPNTVTTIGNYCFGRPNDLPFLKEIILNWNDSSDIIYYNSTWIYGVDGFEHFLIPQGTASLYTAKGYPSNKLVEDATYTTAVVSADKPILSYADGDKATLYAQLVDSQGQPVGASDVSIDFIRVDATTGVFIEILGNAKTDVTGKATFTNGYTSQGIGDIAIQCRGRGFVTETYDIKDAIKYYSGTLTTTTVISVPNLPLDFEMSWKTIRQTGKTAYMKFGLSEAHVIYGGILSAYEDRDNIGIYRYVQGEGNKQGGMISGYTLPANVEKTITMRHENNVASISVDGYSTSFTNTALTSRDYVRADISGGSIKEILIMPIQSINIDVDNPILSYADSTQQNPQIATLTATVNPIESGKTVQIFKDDVLVATEQTDSQGQVSYEYESQGSGDVEFEFKCGLVTESFVVQDIYLYDELTSAKHSWTNTNGTSNQSYSSNGMTVTGNSNGAILVLDETLPSTYSAEVTIIALSPPSNNASKGGGVGLENTQIQPNTNGCTIMKLGTNADWFNISTVLNVDDTIKMIYDGTKVEYYKGTTKLGEIAKGNGASVGFGVRNLKVVNGTSDSITIKDLKIKQL